MASLAFQPSVSCLEVSALNYHYQYMYITHFFPPLPLRYQIIPHHFDVAIHMSRVPYKDGHLGSMPRRPLAIAYFFLFSFRIVSITRLHFGSKANM
jgi:hypothetical protein